MAVAFVLWCAALLIPVTAVMHYVFAAVAMRAAGGSALPLRTATYVQLAAAAANRVVPNGVGAAGVNLRCLQRSGAGTGGAVTALAALGVIGGLTDVAYTAAVTKAGPTMGVQGGTHAFGALTSYGMHAGRHMPWAVIAVAVAVVAVLLVRRTKLRLAPALAALRQAVAHLRALLRTPRRLAVMASASMATTAVLSIGFAATVVVVGHGRVLPGFGALIAIYLVASAIGTATPLPAFMGVTEASLIAGLTLMHVPTVTAVVATLLFRGVAFWGPVPLGVFAARRLRTARLL